MKQTILEVARKWRIDKPHEGKEIITQAIESVNIENMEEQNKKLRQNNEELTKRCERLAMEIEMEKNSM